MEGGIKGNREQGPHANVRHSCKEDMKVENSTHANHMGNRPTTTTKIRAQRKKNFYPLHLTLT